MQKRREGGTSGLRRPLLPSFGASDEQRSRQNTERDLTVACMATAFAVAALSVSLTYGLT